jgi:acylphosphatase
VTPGNGHGALPYRMDETAVRLTAWVHGRVQGVGFRWWTRCRAIELGLVGEARNLPDRRVAVVAEGNRRACERLLDVLRGGATPGRVDGVVAQWDAPRGGLKGFTEA